MTDQDQSRADFEAVYCFGASAEERALVLRRWPDGRYLNSYAQARYEGWQAALNHKADVVPTTEESSGVVLPEPFARAWQPSDAFDEWVVSTDPEKHAAAIKCGRSVTNVYTEQTVRGLLGLAIKESLTTAPAVPPGWTPVGERMPEPGKPVLLDIGKKHPIRAMWAAKFTLEVADCDPGLGEYDVETGEYYCPEGWYEWNEHEECHWSVSAKPISWIPLPQPPKEQT